MRSLAALPAAFLLLASSALAADPDPNDLLGKWELTAAAAGMPAGTAFDFQKGGKLQVVVEKKTIDFVYELKGKVLRFESADKKSDTTEVVTLNKTELVCKDANGTVARFKRAGSK
jgi:uncharacterized protein (TIGR03066 family)